MSNVGILAYGSLIADTGREIAPLIVRRIVTETPFPVEFAKYSTKTRGGAPTLAPHHAGKPVKAEVLVLATSVTLAEAQNLLWRRERRKEGTGEIYSEGTLANSVLVRSWPAIHGLDATLYTDFPSAGKIESPQAQTLAAAAVASVGKAKPGMDGISYLLQTSESGIETALTPAYREEILRLTGAADLRAALTSLRLVSDGSTPAN